MLWMKHIGEGNWGGISGAYENPYVRCTTLALTNTRRIMDRNYFN